jgi:hypothetical protein
MTSQMHIARMKTVLSQICNSNIADRVDVSSIRNLSEGILDLCIAELNRNDIYESARSIVTLQDKKNCLTRLAELFNTRNQPLLPWLSAAVPLDAAGSIGATVAYAASATASSILAGNNDSEVDQIVEMILQDEGVISNGVANLALPTSSSLSSSSSSSAEEPIVTSPLVTTRGRGRKSAAAILAEVGFSH